MSQKAARYWGKLVKTVKSIQTQPSPDEGPTKEHNVITIVSGLPRSGTSMMMKMLDAGGIPPLTDEIRQPDDDNPKGYYEFERVKKLDKGDIAWLEDARGKAVKVIAALLKHLPPDHHYKVIFMQRSLKETLMSQRQMLVRRGKAADKIDDEEMAVLFRKHMQQTQDWLAEQPNFDVLYISYNDVVANPQDQLERVNHFLGNTLDVEKMTHVIDPNLYRQRR